MGWSSPRHDKEHAKFVAANRVEDAEKQLGRSLTSEEMRELYTEAEKTVEAWGRNVRRAARQRPAP